MFGVHTRATSQTERMNTPNAKPEKETDPISEKKRSEDQNPQNKKFGKYCDLRTDASFSFVVEQIPSVGLLDELKLRLF